MENTYEDENHLFLVKITDCFTINYYMTLPETRFIF